jgi:hypothetical protein
MYWRHPAHQAESGKKTIQAEDMVAMQMADEDMIYLAEPYLVPAKLHLGAFSAVY